jgi:DNA sulfur modification protein DndC
MLPLLQLRNELDDPDDRKVRDFRRMNGRIQLFNDGLIHGPYTQPARENWLQKLLKAQTYIRKTGPENVRDLELISDAELEEIRRIWVVEKHEFEDRLPVIYRQATETEYRGKPMDEHLPLNADDVALLRKLTKGDRIHFELVRELLDVEQRHRSMTRRAGLFDALEQALKRGFYTDSEDATGRALRRRELQEEAKDKVRDPYDGLFATSDSFTRPVDTAEQEAAQQ